MGFSTKKDKRSLKEKAADVDYVVPPGQTLNLNNTDFPIAAWDTIYSYTVSVGNQSSIDLMLKTKLLRTSSYQFHVKGHVADVIHLNITNKTGKRKVVWYTYYKSNETTEITVMLGLYEKASVKFIFDGNILGIAPDVPMSAVIKIGDTYSLNPVIKCFLPGTLIRTPEGERAVETLKAGDSVIVFRSGEKRVEKLRWVGTGSAHIRPGLPDDEAAYPICIKANALADSVPHQDLYITSEHCLFLKDAFIPARMLVNGISIFFDHEVTHYTYYHLELEEHGVLTANGAESESYLDTNNRLGFSSETNSKSAKFGARALTWERDAAYPLTTNAAFVHDVHASLQARCGKDSPQAVVTTDTEVSLICEDGSILPCSHRIGERYAFMLPAGVHNVWIASRQMRPCDIHGAYVDDRRYFGVKVGEVSLYDAGALRLVDYHLEKKPLSGWHEIEGPVQGRWTSGEVFKTSY